MERLSKLRITDREGLLRLGLLILALVAALAITTSAQADEAPSGTTTAPAGPQEPAGDQNSPEPASPEGQSPAPAEGASTEATPTEPAPAGEGTSTAPPEESAVVTPEQPISTPAPEEPLLTTPASEETTSGAAAPESQSPAAPSPPVATEEAVVTPPAEVTKELKQSGPAELLEEPASKTPAGEHIEGGAGEAGSAIPLRPASLDTPVAQLDVGHADSAAAEAPAASGAALPVIATIAGTELEGPPPGSGPTAPAHVGMTPVERAGGFGCELSQLGGRMTDNCAVGWLGAPRFASPAPSDFATVASSLVASTIAGSPSEGGHGGAAISSPPVGPAPSPAPGGAAGAATGAAGFAPLSTFLSLAGLLLLGAPRVLRRLRLSCEPWLAGCFVLVPERPD
jgi:hypothetical protein